MSQDTDTKYILYSYFRSTSTARVRTAATLRGIPLEYRYISVPKSEQTTAEYGDINPNFTIPTLVVVQASGKKTYIRQSVAILEYFEEAKLGGESVQLLPPLDDLVGRAYVRDLVQLIAGDIQPPTNRRILDRVRALGGSVEEWANAIMGSGLRAYETMVAPLAGTYSYGDTISLADVALCPAIENAVRYGVDLNEIPTVKRIYEKASKLEAFILADWRHQGDTPEELRG